MRTKVSVMKEKLGMPLEARLDQDIGKKPQGHAALVGTCGFLLRFRRMGSVADGHSQFQSDQLTLIRGPALHASLRGRLRGKQWIALELVIHFVDGQSGKQLGIEIGGFLRHHAAGERNTRDIFDGGGSQ
jgi:hypothetical protein